MSVRVWTGALLVIPAVLAAGCDRGMPAEGAGAGGPAPSSPGARSSARAPAPPPARRRLKPGSKGRDVKDLQRRLKALHYDPGKADGTFGTSTQLAVWAFQAVNRTKMTGRTDKAFWAALDAPRSPRPVAKRREADRVDVDLRRQFLVVYKGGRPALITHVSSGSGEHYCAKDRGATVARCRYASTGTGDFRTGRRASGWEVSPLGRLYNPVYFNGGIAFHGALDVPRYPASHGCVRMPMHVAEYFPGLVRTDVPVHVRRPS
ncbi:MULTISPECIES: L,D-transpeptidase family protein [Thermomonosporaceae]|uniref:L,D-transpeptidase family protein n=1 Tax=Thermomonosporaceae TaxID=2012 RepID=UPI00255A9B60|nr:MULTISPECIES: L,D-transpeptidase family protein [Thermomonosporaceae]MDL4771132.1 L,D-transpeptidase family protein [Actinomadura xylanilytica]